MSEPHQRIQEPPYPVKSKDDGFRGIRVTKEVKLRLDQEQARLLLAGSNLSLSEVIEKAIAGDFAQRVDVSSADRELLAKVKRILGPPQTAVEAAFGDILRRLLAAPMHPTDTLK